MQGYAFQNNQNQMNQFQLQQLQQLRQQQQQQNAVNAQQNVQQSNNNNNGQNQQMLQQQQQRLNQMQQQFNQFAQQHNAQQNNNNNHQQQAQQQQNNQQQQQAQINQFNHNQQQLSPQQNGQQFIQQQMNHNQHNGFAQNQTVNNPQSQQQTQPQQPQQNNNGVAWNNQQQQQPQHPQQVQQTLSPQQQTLSPQQQAINAMNNQQQNVNVLSPQQPQQTLSPQQLQHLQQQHQLAQQQQMAQQQQQMAQAQQQQALNGNNMNTMNAMNAINGQNQAIDTTQQQQTQGADTGTSTADASSSKLNPEVAEFNPFGGGDGTSFGGGATQQISIQEQLFNELQNINTQMTALKYQNDQVLTPTLMQVNQSLLVYHQNPALLQFQQNQLQFTQLQQQQLYLNQQILQNTATYQQYEQRLKYTQEMYQNHKDEQYKVLDDETFNAQLQAQEAVDVNNDENMNTNDQPQETADDIHQTQQGLDQTMEAQKNMQGELSEEQQEEEQMEQYQQPPPPEPGHRNDEIDQLSNAVNQLSMNHHREEPQQQQIEDEVQSKEDEVVPTHKLTPKQPLSSRFQSSSTANTSRFGQRFNESPKSASSIEPRQESQDISPQKDTYLKPYVGMNRADSFESAPSNGSRFLDIMDETEESEDFTDEKEMDDEMMGEEQEEIRYEVMELIKLQKDFMRIRWSKHPNLPRSVRFITTGVNNEKYMRDIVAMFERKSATPWLAPSHVGQAPKDRKEKLVKKLTGVLNKMTPEKFTKIAKMSMDIVNDFAETKDEMKMIIGLVLQFGIKQPVFGGQYAQLCSHLFAHLPKLGLICPHSWVLQDKDVSDTFRKMVIQQTNDLFTTHRKHSPKDIDLDEDGKKITDAEYLELKISKKKDNFFAVMVLVAELYNAELIKKNLVYKGVFEILLPPNNTNLSSIDIEGLCRLFKRCGKNLDRESKKYVDKYLQKLATHARKFDFRTKVLVDEVKEMRANQWKHRLKKEVAKTVQEIRDEFEADQNQKQSHQNHRGYKDDRRGGNRRKSRQSQYDDYEDDDYYNVGYQDYDDHSMRGKHGYTTMNLNKVPLKSGYREKDQYLERSGRRSQSSRDLRRVVGGKNTSSSSSRYHDNHSWGDDQNGKGNGKINKFQPMSPSKSYGLYKKKDKGKPRGLVKTKSVQSNDSDDRYGHHSMNGNGHHQQSNYGEGKTKRKLVGYIDEYLMSGVMDDILDFNCSDFKVWAAVINDGLRDRKSSEIVDFINLIVDLFENEVLHNRGSNFVNIVLKYLSIQADDSSVDCPNFYKYLGQLFANLCFNEYLTADQCYPSFIKKYKEYSEYQNKAKSRNISKLIAASCDELHHLQASQGFIAKIKRYSSR